MENESPGMGGEGRAPRPGDSRLVKHAISARSPAAVVLAEHAKRHGDWSVSSVKIYRRDVVVRKESPFGQDVAVSFGGRPAGAVIKEFSDRGRYRLLFFCKNCDCDFRSMATLTYPLEFPADGVVVKNHLKLLVQRLKRRWPEIRGVWFLEFQRRGAPHFHILFEMDLSMYGDLEEKKRWRGKRKGQRYWTVPAIEQWLARSWFEIVGSGDEKHLRAGVSWEVVEEEEGALRYAATHAAKPHQKTVPEEFYNVGRFWGKIGDLRVVEIGQAKVDAEAVFDSYGVEALSRRGRVRKYLFDAAGKFSADDI